MSAGYLGSDPHHPFTGARAGGGGAFEEDQGALDRPFPKIRRDQLDDARAYMSTRALDVDDALELADMLGIKPSQVVGSRWVEGEVEGEDRDHSRVGKNAGAPIHPQEATPEGDPMTAPLAALPPREVSPDLRARLRAAISDAYYDARNEGRTMESAADRAVEAVLPIVASVDANAHLRGAAEAHVAIARRAGS